MTVATGRFEAVKSALTARFTSVCVKQDGRWLVAHLRSYVYVQR